MAEETSFKTLVADSVATGEFVDRRSRFLAQIVHVSSVAEAEAHLARVQSLYHDARHNVPAWILADGRERCSDDGEPSRTAGAPVLEVLHAAGLRDVSCVVTRYFGGTLLGTGGLIRAYSAAAQAAVDMACEQGLIREMTLVVTVVVDLPYALYDRVIRLVGDEGGRVTDSLFAEDVQLTCVFRAGKEETFVGRLRELASGEDLARVGEPRWGEL